MTCHLKLFGERIMRVVINAEITKEENQTLITEMEYFLNKSRYSLIIESIHLNYVLIKR